MISLPIPSKNKGSRIRNRSHASSSGGSVIGNEPVAEVQRSVQSHIEERNIFYANPKFLLIVAAVVIVGVLMFYWESLSLLNIVPKISTIKSEIETPSTLSTTSESTILTPPTTTSSPAVSTTATSQIITKMTTAIIPTTTTRSSTTTKSNEQFIIGNFMGGRLGNEIFSWASVKGTSAKSNRKYCFKSSYEKMDQMFVGPFSPKCDENIIINHGQAEQAGFVYTEFDIIGNTSIGGYLQSYKYFINDTHDIIAKLALKPELIIEVDQFFSNNVFEEGESNETHKIVAIHVREGDYASKGDDTYLRFPPKEYFLKAMNHFREKYSNNVKFLIASDDIAWCKKQNEFQGDDVYFSLEGNSAVLDLAIISSCDDMIISRGTYGWWSGFLIHYKKGGEVFYNENEMVLEHPVIRDGVLHGSPKEDFFPPFFTSLKCGETTIVTQFYALPDTLNNKYYHNFDNHIGWAIEFFKRIDSSIVMYTNNYTISILEKYKVIPIPRSNVLFITKYQDIFSFPVFDGFNKSFWENKKVMLDADSSIHNPLAKSIVVNEVANENPFQTKFFFYMNIEVFSKATTITKWPSSDRVLEVFEGKHENAIAFGYMHETRGENERWKDKDHPSNYLCSSYFCYSKITWKVDSDYFGGTKDAINNFHIDYWEYIGKNGDNTIGEDHEIIKSLLLSSSPLKVSIILIPNLYSNCGNYILDFFAYPLERNCKGGESPIVPLSLSSELAIFKDTGTIFVL